MGVCSICRCLCLLEHSICGILSILDLHFTCLNPGRLTEALLKSPSTFIVELGYDISMTVNFVHSFFDNRR